MVSDDELFLLVRDLTNHVHDSHTRICDKLDRIEEEINSRLVALEQMTLKHDHYFRIMFGVFGLLISGGILTTLIPFAASILK